MRLIKWRQASVQIIQCHERHLNPLVILTIAFHWIWRKTCQQSFLCLVTMGLWGYIWVNVHTFTFWEGHYNKMLGLTSCRLKYGEDSNVSRRCSSLAISLCSTVLFWKNLANVCRTCSRGSQHTHYGLLIKATSSITVEVLLNTCYCSFQNVVAMVFCQ